MRRPKTTRASRYLAVSLTLAAVVAACGSQTPTATTTTDEVTPAESMPPMPDGSIAWADLPASSSDFEILPAPTPTVDDDAEPCTADQLQATLTWDMKGDNDQGLPRTTANGLIGTVTAHNIGPDCTIAGTASVTLSSGSDTVAVTYEADEQSKPPPVPVPAGGTAQMRLDWSAPFCGNGGGEQVLHITLPNSGGQLDAPAATAMQPACTRSETHPDLTSVLTAGPFDIYRPNTALDSAFNPVTVAVEPVPSVSADDDDLVFYVTLTNPGTTPIPFDPRPGYVAELLSVGRDGESGISTSSIQFLNHRTLDALAPGPTRFEIRVPVPEGLRPGRDLQVTWRLLDRAIQPEDKAVGFTAAIG